MSQRNTNTVHERRPTRRQFLHTLAFTGTGLALAACAMPGGAPAAAPAGETASGEPVLEGTVNYIHHFTSESEMQGLERITAQFNEAYPNINVVQENIPNADFVAKFAAAVQANSRPETSMVTSDRLGDFVAMGGLVPLTEQINNWEKKQYYADSVWEGITASDGELYGIPAFSFVGWMYYRKDWFEEVGITEPPKTLAELTEVAQAITDPEQGRYGFGMRGGDGGHSFVIDVIRAYGSEIVENGEPAIDREKAIEAVAWYASLYTDLQVVPPSAPSDSYRQIMEAFRTGQTGMVWHHTGSLIEIQGDLNEDQFMTATIPDGPAGPTATVSYLYNGIMKEENLDASWAWISHWGNSDAMIAFLEETGYFPASSEVADDERIQTNPYYQAAVETLEFGRLPLQFPGAAGWGRDTVLPAFQKVLLGDATPEQAVDEMIAGLEQAIG